MHKRKYKCGADKRKAKKKKEELEKCANDQRQKKLCFIPQSEGETFLIFNNVKKKILNLFLRAFFFFTKVQFFHFCMRRKLPSHVVLCRCFEKNMVTNKYY